MTTTHYQDIIQHAIDNIQGLDPCDDACELHYFLFNQDYFIIGTYEAKRWLGCSAFDAIGKIQEYEEGNFGEVTTDLSSPEKVANMLAYILGEEVLGQSETLQERWNDSLEDEHLQAIVSELEALNAVSLV